jgi:hypothetical protein
MFCKKLTCISFFTVRKSAKQKNKRSRISDGQRKELCELAACEKNKSLQAITDIFNKKHGLSLDRSTVGKILCNKKRWLAVIPTTAASKRFRHSKPRYPLLDESMMHWVGQAINQGLPLSEDIIKQQGMNFAAKLGLDTDALKFSNGWIHRFKARNNLRCFRIHGEALSAPIESLPSERSYLQQVIGWYNLEDVYNADETGLFFRMDPSETLASQPVSGKKKV